MTAWIVDGTGERLSRKDAAFLVRYSSARARRKLFGNKPSGVGGTLWEREAARDVQAHGEPIKAGRDDYKRWGGTGPRRRTMQWGQYPAYIAAEIERRRPAMRATRAELDALKGVS